MAKTALYPLKRSWLKKAYEDSIWDVGNSCLYQLCTRYPKHTNDGEVAAKIWLIGRAYSAAAERGVSGKGQGESYIRKLAKRCVALKADRYLVHLPKQPASFSQALDQVVKAHHAIESILGSDGRGRVSLTSKYLHFHRPDLFPIYDSRAAAAIAKVTPSYRFTGYELPDQQASSPYGKFCARCAWLADEMTRQKGVSPTLRQLDTMLLQIHSDLVRTKYRENT